MTALSRTIPLLLGVVSLLGGAALALRSETASAHPFGNFTINHSTTIEVSEAAIAVFRVLEYAEIPAFQELQDLPTEEDGFVLLDPWAAEQAELLRTNMQLALDGDDVALITQKVQSEIVEGDGGLSLLRVEVTYTGDLPADWTDKPPRLEYADTAYADKIGWREVIVRGGPGVELVDSSFPVESSTQNLRVYPEDVVESPPDVREASFSFKPGIGLPSIVGADAEPVDPDHETATKGNPDSTLGGFTDLIAEKELSFGFIIVALLTATAFGAIHALSPGHGKTVVAAYLVGSRGTLWHAALLGFTVTVTHTSSVYLLGFVTLYLQQYAVPEDVYPWMGIASGAIVVAMGLALLITRLRASRLVPQVASWFGTFPLLRPQLAFAGGDQGALMMWPRHQHGDLWHDHAAFLDESLDHHHHDGMNDHQHDETEHRHGWGSSHSHGLPPGNGDGEAVTWQRLLGLGIFGGMIPCPSAIVVMLSAIALHRVGFGLVLIVAFSLGLAAVLTGIGFAVVWAQRVPLLKRAMDRAENADGVGGFLMRLLPVAAAALVFVVGVILILRAVSQF